MSRVARSRTNFHHTIDSDLTINSANDDLVREGQNEKMYGNSAAHMLDVEEDHERIRYGDRANGFEHRHMPLKSTLLNDQVPGGSEARRLKQSRNRIPETFLLSEMETRKPSSKFTSNLPMEARINRFDATLSTQRSDSLLDDMRHQETQRTHRNPTKVRNEESVIVGVGQGHQRRTGGGGAFNDMRNDFIQSHFAHPSPATAARHDRLRHQSMISQPRYDDESKAESSDDSESAVESSSSSIEAASNRDPFHAKRSLGESTGNHRGFMKSPQMTKNVEVPSRPKLPNGWQDRLDEVNGHSSSGGSGKGRREKASPFKTINNANNKSLVAASQLYGDLRKQTRPPRSDSASNESGFAAGSQRKPSSASSKGKETEGSTSGATLVNSQSHGVYGSHIRLPSGQRMGKGVPSSGFSLPVDLSGITAALESPVKSRVGVEHRQIMPETVQAFAAATTQEREQQLESLATYIKNIEDKVEHVEDVSNEFANELGSLRKEWKSWRQKHTEFVNRDEIKDVKASKINVHPTQDVHESEDEDATNKFRSKLVNAFHLASDIGQSMEDYRSTLIELRKEEKDLLARESRRSKKVLQSELKQGYSNLDEQEDDLDSLRAQVDAVSREVDRLKIIVERKPSVKKGFSASSPIKPSSRLRSTIHAVGENPFVQRRKVSAESQEDIPNQKTFYEGLGQAPRSRSGSNKEDEKRFVNGGDHHIPYMEDVSMMAEERAERASEKVVEAKVVAHDSQNCTCCARQSENKRRKDARKLMAMQEWKGVDQKSNRRQTQSTMYNNQEDESSARALLDDAMMELEQYVGARLPPALIQLANKQRSLLERTIREEMDEFYHAKRTYCDLADELKSFSPDISMANRGILADHVLVAVEGLELRANRIDRLRAALAAALPGGSLLDEMDGGQGEQGDNDLIGKRTRKNTTRPRYSPPIVDQSSTHANKVNPYKHFEF